MNFIRNFSFMSQNDDYSCGRVCVFMVVDNFKIRHNKKLLSILLKTEINIGTFQNDIIKALRAFDFSCLPKSLVNTDVFDKGKIKSLFNYFLKRGYLAITCVDKGQHWILTRGIKKTRVYIADPDWCAPKYHSIDKFYKRVKGGSVIFVKPKKQ